jgi:MFS family permease
MTDVPDTDRQARADRLKERIYLTFAALAVVLALGSHHPESALSALSTLLVTVFGTLLAIFTADIVSHLVVHGALPTRGELLGMVGASFGALTAVIVPVLFLVLAAFGVWRVETALDASAIALIAALVVIGLAAARRIPLTWWQKLIVLGAEALLGLAVVGLQLLAHGG